MSVYNLPLIDEISEASVGFHKLADGKRMRYAILWPKTKARGTILLGPGRREFIEKKYNEIGKELVDRGFRLIVPEWRGQGLSDRLLEGGQRQRDHAIDFAQHIDDLDHFYESIVQPNIWGPLLVCGHSMGSHLLLRWLMQKSPQIEVRAAIVTAPMLALAGHAVHISANFVSWGASKLGYDIEYAASQHDFNEQDRIFSGNPLTHDPVRFALMEKYFRLYPELTVGGVTWGWMHAAIQSMNFTQRQTNLGKLVLPILSITGGQDQVTPLSEIEHYIRMMPGAASMVVPGSRHDVMNELSEYRVVAWGYIDRFLERELKI